ncbi:MAG TPA: isochorismatase family protein [Terriglobia bacterium]
MARHRIVFVDVDTQADFMLPGGKLYVPEAEKLLPTIARLRDFAERNGVPVLASTDAHATDDPEFRQWPPHCVRGTPGQLKVPESLLAQYVVVPRERRAPLSEDELARYRQWIVEKDKLDLFSSPQAEEIVRRLDADEYFVYGVATEYCVRLAVLGLRKLGCKVALLTDAIRGIDAGTTEAALREMRAAGAELIHSDQVLAARVSA